MARLSGWKISALAASWRCCATLSEMRWRAAVWVVGSRAGVVVRRGMRERGSSVGGMGDGSCGGRGGGREASGGDAVVGVGLVLGWRESGMLGRGSKGVGEEMGRWVADEAGEE